MCLRCRFMAHHGIQAFNMNNDLCLPCMASMHCYPHMHQSVGNQESKFKGLSIKILTLTLTSNSKLNSKKKSSWNWILKRQHWISLMTYPSTKDTSWGCRSSSLKSSMASIVESTTWLDITMRECNLLISILVFSISAPSSPLVSWCRKIEHFFSRSTRSDSTTYVELYKNNNRYPNHSFSHFKILQIQIQVVLIVWENAP